MCATLIYAKSSRGGLADADGGGGLPLSLSLFLAAPGHGNPVAGLGISDNAESSGDLVRPGFRASTSLSEAPFEIISSSSTFYSFHASFPFDSISFAAAFLR